MAAADWMKYFFEFMSCPNSYAGGGKATPLLGMPGWKGYDNERGPYRVLDAYTTLPGGFSKGSTHVWEGQQTRMHMSYGGWYRKEATLFLKRILLDQYKNERFLGFRGPAKLVGEDYTYKNSIIAGLSGLDDVDRVRVQEILASGWHDGMGRETMLSKTDNRLVGEHAYHYMTFTPPEPKPK